MRWFTKTPTRNRIGTTAAKMPKNTATAAAVIVAIITAIIAIASTLASLAATVAVFSALVEWSGLFSVTQDTATPTTTATMMEVSTSSASLSYFSSTSFSVSAGSGPGFGSGSGSNKRQTPCETSDDPDYPCLVSRPPGAFDNEIRIYLSSSRSEQEEDEDNAQQLLNVKVVVPKIAGLAEIRGLGRSGVWVSLGFSPNGKMAGPSEAVVGVVEEKKSDQGPHVLRYRMRGYSPSSVTPLPDCDQILTNGAVESSTNGSLVFSFSRPFSLPQPRGQGCHSLAQEEEGEENVLAWLDPREEGVVVLWAFGSRSPWPSYHDATGAFVLPTLL